MLLDYSSQIKERDRKTNRIPVGGVVTIMPIRKEGEGGVENTLSPQQRGEKVRGNKQTWRREAQQGHPSLVQKYSVFQWAEPSQEEKSDVTSV